MAVSLRRKALSWVVASVVLTLVFIAPVYADSWTGSLTSADGGIEGLGAWIDNDAGEGGADVPVTLDWTVSEVLNGSGQVLYWHYEYTLEVWSGNGSISHFIIEATDTFEDSAASWFNVTGPYGWTGENEVGAVEIQAHEQGSGNPGMPDDLAWGIKFDETSQYGDTFAGTFSFDSFHQPVWGDFYAKDGASYDSAAWNKGFADNDPTAPPQDGHLDYHLLVPDSKVPEPISLVFFATGLVGVFGFVARRKMRSKD